MKTLYLNIYDGELVTMHVTRERADDAARDDVGYKEKEVRVYGGEK